FLPLARIDVSVHSRGGSRNRHRGFGRLDDRSAPCGGCPVPLRDQPQTDDDELAQPEVATPDGEAVVEAVGVQGNAELSGPEPAPDAAPRRLAVYPERLIPPWKPARTAARGRKRQRRPTPRT